MELLLILSAMLSAVTGAFTGARGPEARVPQAEAAVGAQIAAAVVEQRAAPATTDRPADAPPSTEFPALRDFGLAAAVPVDTDRLRE